MKKIVFFFLYIFGIHKVFFYLNREKLLILLYHGIDGKRKKFVSPENFEKQISYLKKNYNIISLGEAVNFLKKRNLPPRSVVITFDDGYANIHDFAYPILKTHKIPATVFLSTDFIDKKVPLWTDRVEYSINETMISNKTKEEMKEVRNDKKNETLAELENKNERKLDGFSEDKAIYSPLSWENIGEMQKENISFGAHTESHAILTKVPEEIARKEIANSKEIIKNKTGKVSNVFAYPNGQKNDFNESIKEIVQKEGFVAALTTIAGFNDNDADLFELRRMTMDATNNFLVFLATISGLKTFIQKIKS